MILSLFGPDGVGKSTVSKALAEDGWLVFSGTSVASWPDQSWHQSLLADGIDETGLDKDEHFLEKIRRSHELARQLEAKNAFVVIDSDPFHKTLFYDYMRCLPDVEKGKALMKQRFVKLKQIAADKNLIHVYFQVSNKLDDESQAKILQERVVGRGKVAYFDPKDLSQSLSRVQACRELKELLVNNGERVLTVTTDEPFNSLKFREAVSNLDQTLAG